MVVGVGRETILGRKFTRDVSVIDSACDARGSFRRIGLRFWKLGVAFVLFGWRLPCQQAPGKRGGCRDGVGCSNRGLGGVFPYQRGHYQDLTVM